MCGRFTLRAPAERVKREFRLEEAPSVEARYNIAPTQSVLAVRRASDEREAVTLKWGLIPSWAKDGSMGAKLINARSETVEEKPSFREAFKRRRCIIPADGFYEWQRTGGRKQPYYFRLKDDRLFGFAGLWENWHAPDGSHVRSATIITTEPNELVKPIHNRMPAMLKREDYQRWLEPGEQAEGALMEMLRPYPSEEMELYPISTLVNSAKNEGEELIKPAEPVETPRTLFD